MENFVRRIKTFIVTHPYEFFALFAILTVGAFLRMYRLPEFMMFLGDQGRDVLVVKRMLVDHKLTLIGPQTSVGNMYLGPLYYYLMALPLLFSRFDPVGAVYMVAALHVATIFLLYLLGREWFNGTSGLVAASLFAVSPKMIEFAQFSWNPNPVPFFLALALLSFTYIIKYKKDAWWLVVGIAFASLLQMHYLTVFFGLTILILWVGVLKIRKNESQTRPLLKFSFLGGAIFTLLMLPLPLFDIRHEFLNSRALLSFLKEGNGVSTSVSSIFSDIPGRFTHLFTRFIGFDNIAIGTLLATLGFFAFIILLGDRRRRWSTYLFFIWVGTGILGVSVYKGPLFDHYLGFLFLAPFIGVSCLFYVLQKQKALLLPLSLFVLFLLSMNTMKNHPFGPAQDQLGRTKRIDASVLERTDDLPFHFALIAERNYDSAYQYFFELWGRKPLSAHDGIVPQLFVVCEDEVCQPIGHPKWEIASFGWAQIEDQWIVDGTRVFKLVRFQEDENAVDPGLEIKE